MYVFEIVYSIISLSINVLKQKYYTRATYSSKSRWEQQFKMYL